MTKTPSDNALVVVPTIFGTSVSKTILQLLARIAETGAAIVIVSHDEKVLKALCHRVLRMHEGVLSD